MEALCQQSSVPKGVRIDPPEAGRGHATPVQLVQRVVLLKKKYIMWFLIRLIDDAPPHSVHYYKQHNSRSLAMRTYLRHCQVTGSVTIGIHGQCTV